MRSSRGDIKGRGRKDKKPHSVILFSAEGDNKTESLYLTSFNSRGKPSIIPARGNETDPVKMMRQLNQRSKELHLSVKNGDRAYCLVDTDADESKQVQINKALKMRTEYSEVIISSPCFEEWYLCHFRFSAGARTSGETIRELRIEMPDYQKNSNPYSELKDKTAEAIKNARRLESFHDENGIPPYSVKRNPSTDVYKIIEKLV